MSSQNPFPAPATTDGYQSIAGSCSEGDQLFLWTGNLVKMVTLVNVPTIGYPLSCVLTYNSRANAASPVGNNWRCNVFMNLIISMDVITYVDPTGRRYDFVPDGMGGWTQGTTSYYFPGYLVADGSDWQIVLLE